MLLSPDEQLVALIGAEQEHYFSSRDGQIVARDVAQSALGAIALEWRKTLSPHAWEVLPTDHWAQRVEQRDITAVAKWYDRESGWIRALPVFVAELELKRNGTSIPLERSGDVTLAIAVTNDGHHFLGGGRSGRIAVWRAEDGRLSHDFQVCRRPIVAIAAARDLKSVFFFFLPADGFLGISALQVDSGAEPVPLDTKEKSIGLFLSHGGEWVTVVAADGGIA
jgi:hypothetical protein